MDVEESTKQQMRATSHDRLASKILVEKKATGLLQVRDRLASETTEERQARLQQMSVHQREKLASKTTKEREARLQQMRDRLASEITEERKARLQRMHDRLIIQEYGDGGQATADGCHRWDRHSRILPTLLNNPRLMQSMICFHPNDDHTIDN